MYITYDFFMECASCAVLDGDDIGDDDLADLFDDEFEDEVQEKKDDPKATPHKAESLFKKSNVRHAHTPQNTTAPPKKG